MPCYLSLTDSYSRSLGDEELSKVLASIDNPRGKHQIPLEYPEGTEELQSLVKPVKSVVYKRSTVGASV